MNILELRPIFTDRSGDINMLDPDVDRYINTEEVQNRLFAMEPDKRERETIREKEKFIVGRITAAGGIGATAKNPETFGKSIIFAVFAETFAILGLLMSLLIINGVGLL